MPNTDEILEEMDKEKQSIRREWEEYDNDKEKGYFAPTPKKPRPEPDNYRNK
jgi:hypothetical protein